MKKIYNIRLSLLLLSLLIVGCDNYLDVVPEDDLRTVESSFQKRSSALTFFYSCHEFFGSEGRIVGSQGKLADPAVLGGDELTGGQCLRSVSNSQRPDITDALKLSSGLQSPTAPLFETWGFHGQSNLYEGIRNCNTFIENIDRVYDMDQAEKDQYKGGAKAAKALYYFELMKRYGPICLIDKNENLETPTSELLLPRMPIDSCVNEIVRLFEEAIDLGITTIEQQLTVERGSLTREAAYAYKAKVLLWAASPFFNGNKNGYYAQMTNKNGQKLFPTYDAKKWERAAQAAKEALEYCTQKSNRRLYNGYTQESSPLLINIRNIQFSVLPLDFGDFEWIHAVQSKGSDASLTKLPRITTENFTTSVLLNVGTVSPTMKMVELFYTENGLPITKDATWHFNERYKLGTETSFNYENVVSLEREVLKLHLRREPRFYANIAFDGGIWRRRAEYVTMEAYREGTHGFQKTTIAPDDKVNITGYWCKKLVHPSIAVDKSGQTVQPMCTYIEFRLAELYLILAEAWNEAYGPEDGVAIEALDVVRDRAGIPDVKTAWGTFAAPGFSTEFSTKEGLREIIRTERGIELAFESKRFWDLRRWHIAHLPENLSGPLKGWVITGGEGAPFYNSFNGPITVWQGNKFDENRDYLWPLSALELLNSQVVQNPGW